MSGDYSRFNFDPTHDYDGVLLQQGRPLTDWDWNEEVILRSRRRQASVADMFGDHAGKAVFPKTTPHGFEIEVSNGQMTIGVGRLYVDGIMIENHGLSPLAWDPVLAEPVGTLPWPYRSPGSEQPGQPYLPDPPPLPTTSSGPCIVYVDVWQREVSRLQQMDLIDPALGVDTTTRLQTVWQVKVSAPAPAGTTCATDVTTLDAWKDAIRAPSGGRLSTGTGGVAQSTDPCQIPPAAGYKGLENQLYRVEIHDGGDLTKATFKWSRDNASIETRVSNVVGGTKLIVESTGKDDYLRFNPGDWIELTDDWQELSGKPGQILRIADADGVEDATGTLTVTTAVDGTRFPVDGTTSVPQRPNTRIRRWDQRTDVLNPDGTIYWNARASTTGVIPVPPGGGSLILEAGVMVTFSLAASGAFNAQDFWTFTARATTGEVEALTEAPPRGIHHHYAKLAIVTFPDGSAADCRAPWPPDTAADLCGCKVCVTPDLHNNGTLTIEEAVNKAAATGGLVCLMPGAYRVSAPIKISQVRSVRVVGQGSLTRLVAPAGPAFVVSGGHDIVLADFAVVTGGGSDSGPVTTAHYAAITASDVAVLHLERLFVDANGNASTAVAFGGGVEAKVTDCRVQAAIGLGWLAQATGTPAATATVDLVVDGNTLTCSDHALQLVPGSSQQLRVRVTDNQLGSSSRASIDIRGGSSKNARVDVSGNRIATAGSGVVARVAGARLADNDILYKGRGIHAGLDLDGGTGKTPPRDWLVTGNRISSFRGSGIVFGGVAAGLVMAHNIVEHVGQGIILASDALVQSVTIDANEVSDCAGVGLAVQNAQSAAIGGNLLRKIGTAGATVALHVSSCVRVDVSRNEITGVGPPSGSFDGNAYGIAISHPIGLAEVRGNVVRRDLGAKTGADGADFRALIVGAVVTASGVAPPLETVLQGLQVSQQGSQQGTPVITTTSATSSNPTLPLGIQVEPSSAADLATAAADRATPAATAHLEAQVPVTERTGSAFRGPIYQPVPQTFLTDIPTPERLLVDGNQLETRGSGPVVHINTPGSCTFTANQCLHRGASDELTQPKQNIFIRAATIIFCNNQTSGGGGAALRGPKDAFDKDDKPDVSFTAIGNVVDGEITVNKRKLTSVPPFKGLPDGVAATLNMST